MLLKRSTLGVVLTTSDLITNLVWPIWWLVAYLSIGGGCGQWLVRVEGFGRIPGQPWRFGGPSRQLLFFRRRRRPWSKTGDIWKWQEALVDDLRILEGVGAMVDHKIFLELAGALVENLRFLEGVGALLDNWRFLRKNFTTKNGKVALELRLVDWSYRWHYLMKVW